MIVLVGCAAVIGVTRAFFVSIGVLPPPSREIFFKESPTLVQFWRAENSPNILAAAQIERCWACPTCEWMQDTTKNIEGPQKFSLPGDSPDLVLF